MSLLTFIRVVLGSVFVLFVPGYFLMQAFFKKEEIDFLEKITLSIVLSITSVPLAILFLNVIFGVKINAVNTTVIILMIAVVSYIYTKYIKKE
ncbi:DUF1616 domain-containing protein [Patescibacteria group bacterium]|nr:DUF1616 domain-containing protein [Patescibacteria group bacterium]